MNENKEEKNEWQNWNNETNEYVTKEITNEWTKECKVESDDGGGRNFRKRIMKRCKENYFNGMRRFGTAGINYWRTFQKSQQDGNKNFSFPQVNSSTFSQLTSILFCVNYPLFFMTWLLCLSLLFYFYNISFSFCCYSN